MSVRTPANHMSDLRSRRRISRDLGEQVVQKNLAQIMLRRALQRADACPLRQTLLPSDPDESGAGESAAVSIGIVPAMLNTFGEAASRQLCPKTRKPRMWRSEVAGTTSSKAAAGRNRFLRGLAANNVKQYSRFKTTTQPGGLIDFCNRVSPRFQLPNNRPLGALCRHSFCG